MIDSPYGTVVANDIFASGIIMSEYVSFFLSSLSSDSTPEVSEPYF